MVLVFLTCRTTFPEEVWKATEGIYFLTKVPSKYPLIKRGGETGKLTRFVF